VLAVLVVAAALALFQVRLTILHLVGMLLIVAIGSNYALFFDSQQGCGEDSVRLWRRCASPMRAPSSASAC